MPSIILPCPHCLAEKVGFNIASEYRASAPRESPMDIGGFRIRAVMICSNCEEIVIGLFEKRAGWPRTGDPE